MKRSERDLRAEDCSASSRMRDTALSPKGRVVRTRSRPVRLTQPLEISSPGAQGLGRLSPVRAEVSSALSPSMTTPSIGTRSPGRTTMTLPGATSSGSTETTSPSRSSSALSGRRSMSAAMLPRLRPTAYSSKSAPSW